MRKKSDNPANVLRGQVEKGVPYPSADVSIHWNYDKDDRVIEVEAVFRPRSLPGPVADPDLSARFANCIKYWESSLEMHSGESPLGIYEHLGERIFHQRGTRKSVERIFSNRGL